MSLPKNVRGGVFIILTGFLLLVLVIIILDRWNKIEIVKKQMYELKFHIEKIKIDIDIMQSKLFRLKNDRIYAEGELSQWNFTREGEESCKELEYDGPK